MTDSVTIADERTLAGRTHRNGWIAFAGIAMLVVSLAILRSSVSLDGGDVSLSVATVSLPQLTLSAIVAGIAMGLWAVHFFPRVRPTVASALAGCLTGALASAAVLMVRGIPSSAVLVLALALAVTGALGGLIAAIRPDVIPRGGVIATLVALLLFYVVAFNSSWLLRVFGDDGTAAGRLSANGLLAGAQALIVGILCGVIAFLTVRRSRQTVRWPAYLLAGGMPGLLWIVAEVFTRIGTARLLSLASSDSAADRIASAMAGAGRINTGLVLFFVGAVTAMILFGRTLKPTPAN
jgi:hypothetical protein